MFKLNAIPVRHYEFENPGDGTVLHIRPPKLETMEIFNKVFGDASSAIKDLAGITGAMLSNNEEGVRITAKELMYWADSDQLAALIDDFLGWLNKTKADNPN